MGAGDLTICYMRRQRLQAVKHRIEIKDVPGLYALGFNAEEINRMTLTDFMPIWEAAWSDNDARLTGLLAAVQAAR